MKYLIIKVSKCNNACHHTPIATEMAPSTYNVNQAFKELNAWVGHYNGCGCAVEIKELPE